MWNWLSKVVDVFKRPVVVIKEFKQEESVDKKLQNLAATIRVQRTQTKPVTPPITSVVVDRKDVQLHALPGVLSLNTIEPVIPSTMDLYRKHKREDQEKKARKAAEDMIKLIHTSINNKDIDGARSLFAEAKSIMMEYGTKKHNTELSKIAILIKNLQSELVDADVSNHKNLELERIIAQQEILNKELEEEFCRRENERARNEKAILDSDTYLRQLETKEIIELKRKCRLQNAHLSQKKDTGQIRELFEVLGIKQFYHITDSRNLFWIKKYGGLLSYQFMQDEGIMTSYPGSSPKSIQRDIELDTSNYIKLSICIENNLLADMKNKGIIPMILKIKPDEIVGYNNTKFSNESILRTSVKIGDNKGFLSDQINWEEVQKNRCYDKEPYGFSSPEILVSTFIDIKDIININNPEYV